MSFPKSSTPGLTYHSVELRGNPTFHSEEYLNPIISNSPLRSQHTNGKRRDIAWNAFYLVFPMLTLTGLLFAFIFGYQTSKSGEPFKNLRGDGSSLPKEDAYYVHLNSTLLIFLVSWMSSLAPMLAGFAITLAAYPVAADLFRDTTPHHQERLLSPFQLHLALRFIGGSTWSAIWNLMRYRLGWGKRVKQQGAALVSLSRVALAVVLLSILVFAADTWLHVVTKTVDITKLSVLPNPDATYGLSLLSPNCTTTDNTIPALAAAGLTCTMDPMTALLGSGSATIQTLNNQSNALSVLSNGLDPSLAYLTVNPSDRNAQLDFTAITYGVRTSCHPISRSCNLTSHGNTMTWNCSNGAFAQATSNYVGSNTQVFFDDEDMTSSTSSGAIANPFYFAFAATTIISSNPITNITDDPEITTSKGGFSAILMCSVSVYDLTYDIVQGNVTSMVPVLSNLTVANVFMPALSQSGFGYPNRDSVFNMAASVSATAQDLADQFSLSYSKIALSVSAGSVTRSPVLAAQTRTSMLVARVPKAPLFLLVAANLLFVVMGVILAVIALRTPPEAYEIQTRFGIAGLVAGMFEGDTARTGSIGGRVERLYAEYYAATATSGDDGSDSGSVRKRIGMSRGVDGGYEFRAVEGDVHSQQRTDLAYHGWNGRWTGRESGGVYR